MNDSRVSVPVQAGSDRRCRRTNASENAMCHPRSSIYSGLNAHRGGRRLSTKHGGRLDLVNSSQCGIQDHHER